MARERKFLKGAANAKKLRVRPNGSKKGVNGASKSRSKIDLKSLSKEELLKRYPNGNPSIGLGNPNGRPSAPNNMTKAIKFAIMGAIEDVGEDGKGKGGARGYMRRLAIYEPAVFAGLLKRCLPVQFKADLDPNSLLSKLMQTAVATRSVQDGKPPIDITPTPIPPPPRPNGGQGA